MMARFYRDGTPRLPSLVPGARSTAAPIYLGCDRNNNLMMTPPGVPDRDFLDGRLDEIRIERTTRSQAWITADVVSMRDQLISYGPIER